MQKANPKAVGIFVIGAITLLVAALLVFGGRSLFDEKHTMIAYFRGNLAGLRVGAPVEMQGVQIGTVTNVEVRADPNTLEFTFPVLMEIESSRIVEDDKITAKRSDRATMELLIGKGLRARLAPQSLVTGQQVVQIEFLPDTKVIMSGENSRYVEIPTVLSTIERVQDTIDDLVGSSATLAVSLNKVLNEKNRKNFETTLENVAKMSGTLNEASDRLVGVLGRTDRILANIESQHPQYTKLLKDADEMVVAVRKLSENTDKMLAENRKGLRDFTESGLPEIRNLAVDAQGAVEQFRRVMEEMERDPARFFLGEPGTVKIK